MTLSEAIHQLVTFGERDPYTIATKLVDRHKNEEWFRAEVVAYSSDLIADLARRQIGNDRRSAERAIDRGDAATQTKFLGNTIWIPDADGVGAWKAVRDCTADDLRARAEYHAKLARLNWLRAAYYNRLADLIDFEGAATLGDVRAPLPELPGRSVEEIDQMELAA